MTDALAVVLKDPDEKITLTLDWTDFLASGETISGTPAWAVDEAPTGDATPLAVDGSAAVSGNVASQRFQAGTARQLYRARCRMTTSLGNVHDRSFTVRIGTQ